MNAPLSHTEQIEALSSQVAMLKVALRQAESEILTAGTVGGESAYSFGAELSAPFTITLAINPKKVSAERFRADLPALADKLEGFIANAVTDAAIQSRGAA
jgi:hypothetical protein